MPISSPPLRVESERASSQLERVETVPNSESVVIHFKNGVKIDLAPDEQSLVGAGGPLTFALSEDMVLEMRRFCETQDAR